MEAVNRIVRRYNIVKRYKQASKDKFVGADVRLTWSRDSFLLEELPQKGKKQLLKAYLQNPRGPAQFLDWFLPSNILMLAKLSTSDSYADIKKKIEKAYETAVEKTKAQPHHPSDLDALKWVTNLKWSEDKVSYLHVVPEGTDPIEANGTDFRLISKWTTFKTYSPSSDFEQATPHYTIYEQSSAAGARKLYNILKTNPNALKSVSWHGLDKWFTQNGIKYRTHHSQWT